MNIARHRTLDCNGEKKNITIHRNGKYVILTQGSDVIKIHSSKITMLRNLLKHTDSEAVDWLIFDYHNTKGGGMPIKETEFIQGKTGG